MKKISCMIFIAVIISINGCNSDGDILATYKNASITRGDFYKWLESKKYNKESIIKSKSRQKDRLQKMAIELITVAKAKDEGFEENEAFQVYKDQISESILMKRLYDMEIREKASFKEPSIKARVILLRVKDYELDPKERNKRVKLSKEELDKKYDEILVKAGELIKRLDKGEGFEELAKQYSEDYSKRSGGDIGYIVYDMMPADFSEAAFSLKEGEYTKEPVKTSRGIYIIKVEDKKELTDKNIEDIIENKNQAARIKSGLLRTYAKEYIDKLMKAEDVSFFDDKVLSKDKNDIIFRVGDKDYMVADLDKRIESRQSGAAGGDNPKRDITDTYKERMAKSYYQYEVLKRDALKKGLDKDAEYLKERQTRLDAILAREYTKDVLSKDIIITDQEIKEEYEKNKDKRYYKMVTKGKKRVKQIEPLKNVKEKIERNLSNRKKSERTRNWEREILREYDFKIDESQLKEEK